jgi:hypothetical protein
VSVARRAQRAVHAAAIETHRGSTVADVAAAGVPLEVRERVVDAEFGNEVGVLVRPEGAA